MKFASQAFTLLAIAELYSVTAFTPAGLSIRNTFQSVSSSSPFKTTGNIFATVEDEKTDEKEAALESKSDETIVESTTDEDVEGLPWWWDLVWKLDVMKLGEPGTECTFGDSANVLRTNIEQIYGGFPSLDGCPLAEGDIADIADGTQFIGLNRYQQKYGSPYKLCFGPKSFLTVSDPIQAKHILRDANSKYDKGLLAGEKVIHIFFITPYRFCPKAAWSNFNVPL